jgi:type I restriction enzyme S subunit
MSKTNFKQTRIGKIPEDWEVYKLGNYVNLIKGISYQSKDYCSENEGHIFINLKCVARNGGFREEGVKFYKGDVKEEQFVKPGDIVIGNTDLTQNREIIGSPMKIPDLKDNRKMCISLDISKLDIINKELNNDFLYYYLMSPNARHFMISNSNGTTVLHLLTKNIPNMLIPVPLLSEQKAIASVLSSLDDKIDLLHHQNKTLGAMAEALFRQWFVEEADEGWEAGKLGGLVVETIGGDWGKENKSQDTIPVICLRGVDLQAIKDNGFSADAPIRYIRLLA